MNRILHSIHGLLNVAGVIWAQQLDFPEGSEQKKRTRETEKALRASIEHWVLSLHPPKDKTENAEDGFDYEKVVTGIQAALGWVRVYPYLDVEQQALEQALQDALFYRDHAQEVKASMTAVQINVVLEGALHG